MAWLLRVLFCFFSGRSVDDMSGNKVIGDHNPSDCEDTVAVEIRRVRRQNFLFRSLGSISVVFVLAFFVSRASLSKPESYRAALAMSQADAEVYRIGFEAKMIELGNVVREKDDWKSTITQAEINGWLAANREFSKTLPKVISQPRVVLANARMSVIFGCEILGFNAILQGELDVFCTDVPGQIAFRIYQVRSGWVPLPVDAFADQFTKGMLSYGADVEWGEIDGDPVALLLFPEDLFLVGTKALVVQAIEIEERKLMITGKSKLRQ
jgi:hypothetical protein